MKHGDGVGREEFFVAADSSQAEAQVLGGVVRRERIHAQPGVDAREERAVMDPREPAFQFQQTDEDEGEQRLRVPLVVEEDVEVVEDLLVKEVSLVEEEDRVKPLLAELFDVGGDGVEDGCSGSGGRQVQRQAKLPVEVAAAQRGVVAIGEAEAGRWKTMTQRPEVTAL